VSPLSKASTVTKGVNRRPESSHDAAATVALEAARELRRATAMFAPFNSPHEGWAVIREELDELWEHVRANDGRSENARAEAIQLAAMALRYAVDLCDGCSP